MDDRPSKNVWLGCFFGDSVIKLMVLYSQGGEVWSVDLWADDEMFLSHYYVRICFLPIYLFPHDLRDKF